MDNLITVILAGIIGSGLTYWFGVRHLKTETEIKVKVEKYNNLIKYLRGFIGNEASNPETGSDLKKIFFQEWETTWLYCSDDVFAAIRKFVEYVRDLDRSKVFPNGHDELGNSIAGDIIVAMRKDLIRKRTRLTNKDFIFWDVREK